MKKITLPNRSGNNNYLLEIENNKYKAVFDKNNCYYSITMINDNEYKSIDPEGGPMISVGDIISENKKINKIYKEDNNIFIETKEDEK